MFLRYTKKYYISAEIQCDMLDMVWQHIPCDFLLQLCPNTTGRRHVSFKLVLSEITQNYPLVTQSSAHSVNLMEWMHSNVPQPELKTAWIWWINCSKLKRPTGNECLSIANATPSPRSLQPSTTPGVISVFFSHLHCRTRTMAQVPTLVAKSLFTTTQLALSNMKTLFWLCCNYLKQLSPLYASKGAKITQPVMGGYGESVGLIFQPLLLTHGSSRTIMMVHCNK